MEKLKSFLFAFVCVTTCVIFATAVYIGIFWGDIEVSSMILWQILATSFVSSLGVLIYPKRELTKKALRFRAIIQYIYTNVVVLTAGFVFGWFYFDQWPMVAGMLVIIAIIFFGILTIMTARDKHFAKQLNDKLKELNDEN